MCVCVCGCRVCACVCVHVCTCMCVCHLCVSASYSGMQKRLNPVNTTHRLALHPLKQRTKDLSQGRLSSCLVDRALAGEIDVVTAPHSKDHCASMYITGGGCHDGEECL